MKAIATKLHVSLDALLAANGLTKKSVIHPGDQLIVPAGGILPSTPPSTAPSTPPTSGSTYTVKRGDYFERIARALGVTVNDLLAVNGMKKSTVIHAGMQLKVPDRGTAPAPTDTSIKVTTVPSAAPSTPPTSGSTYTVKRGDYFERIARALGVTVNDLLAVNGMKKSTVIHAGLQLKVPAGGTAPPTVVLAAFPTSPTCAFSSTYGAPRPDGRKHEGVDIMVGTGTHVLAVVDGTITKKQVTFAGSRAGNTLSLTAADSTYFFYGHLSDFAPGIEVGSVVTAGTLIGFVGATGNTSVPHLHFEVHPSGGKAVDPYPIVKAISSCNK